MKYKIHTVPIWDAYRADSECPLCAVERELENKILAGYLNEAVMEPRYRVDVNKHGFCAEHFQMLGAGDNVCGVGLQAQTRMQALRADLTRPANGKAAKKEGERLERALSSCVVCRQAEETMERYYETVAAMFHSEGAFEATLRKSKGHCLRHYAKLLQYAHCAASDAGRFADVLYNVQIANLARLDSELQGFLDKFDSAKRNDRPWGNSKDAVPRVIDKIKGM